MYKATSVYFYLNHDPLDKRGTDKYNNTILLFCGMLNIATNHIDIINLVILIIAIMLTIIRLLDSTLINDACMQQLWRFGGQTLGKIGSETMHRITVNHF